MAKGMAAAIRIGIGGWSYAPWRGTFYPAGLPQKKELEYASSRLTSIEINGTFYGTQKRESFIRWREETPQGFVFSVKGPRFTVTRPHLGEAGASLERFFGSGVLELKEKLGPINWQLPPTKSFAADEIEAFLKLLPASIGGQRVRHVLEVRHDSFRKPEFLALLRAHGAAAVYTDKDSFPQLADITADFLYARLQRAAETEERGYAEEALTGWAARAIQWANGAAPADLPWIGPPAEGAAGPREVFIYMINGFKPKAPAAAMALIEKLGAAAS